MFDTLATYDAFAPDPKPRADLDEAEADDEPRSPWRRVTDDFLMRRVANHLVREWHQNHGGDVEATGQIEIP